MVSLLFFYLIFNLFLVDEKFRVFFINALLSDLTPSLGIIATIISIASILISWYVHRHRIDYEISREHFKQLKNQVIKPLLTLLEKDYNNLPSVEEIKNKSNIYGFLQVGHAVHYIHDSGTLEIGNDIILDCDLIIDFLENHYLKLISLWNDAFALIHKKNVNLEKLKNYLKIKLQSDVDKEFFNSEKNKQEFKSNEYIDHFIKLLETDSYKETLFEIRKTGYDWKNLNFDTVVIFVGESLLCEKLKTILININNDILNHDTIIEYLKSNKETNKQLRIFYTTLKNVSFRTKLKFEKFDWYKKRCEFVKENI